MLLPPFHPPTSTYPTPSHPSHFPPTPPNSLTTLHSTKDRHPIPSTTLHHSAHRSPHRRSVRSSVSRSRPCVSSRETGSPWALRASSSTPGKLDVSCMDPTLPYPTLPYPTLPYPTLPYPTLPYSTLPYPTLPYSSIVLNFYLGGWVFLVSEAGV
jgi:hypothetical protein